MTDRLTPEREAEIEQRVAAATPGPWGSYRDLNAVYTIQARPRTTRNGMENDGDIATLATDRSDAESYANARFITHAREDVRALLAELSKVRAERNTARAERDAARARVAELEEERRLADKTEATQADGTQRLCGKDRGISGLYYRPCARPVGHKEAYCRSADGSHLFLAGAEQDGVTA